jgi:triphosphatase
MILHTERELKFAANGDTLRAALTIPLPGEMTCGPVSRVLKSTYFDTETLELMRRGVSLRVRQSGKDCLLGVKKNSHAHRGYFERDEEEAPLPSSSVDLNVLDDRTSSELRKIIGKKALAPRFGSEIRRTLKAIRFHGADIEVALDEGFLFAGERREPTDEIELELKAGKPVALFDFGLALVDALPLTPSILSKAERAADLLSGKPPEPVRSTSPALVPDLHAEKVIGMLFQNCFSQFLCNLPVLERGDPVEAVHQMHIAMRRLRSAFGLVCRLSPSAEFDALQTEAKRIGRLLGQARDWDVFIQNIRDGPLPSFTNAPGFDKFVGLAQWRAKPAHGSVTQLAKDGTVARFALSLDRFIAARGLRGDPQSDRPDYLSEPIVDFAIKSLNRLHRKLLRRGKGFKSQSFGERHALRIAAKRMRYAVEFFGCLFHPYSAAERYIDKAQALQDLLGRQNDATIALGLVKTLDYGVETQFAHAAGIAAGWYARSNYGDEPALRKAWRSLRKAEPFWRDGG